jgi:futalosine hydrolase
MKILIISATTFEIDQTVAYLNNHWKVGLSGKWESENHEVEILITGVGSFNTMYELINCLKKSEYSLIIQAGIGGAYQKDKQLGCVYYLNSERFGDIGLEEKNGNFTSIFETSLINKDEYPFVDGILNNPGATFAKFLPSANGITMNTVTGTNNRANKLCRQYPDIEIESMEGAPFFYVCLKEKVPFMSLRSVSNYVEDRNKDNWKIKEAIESLNSALSELLKIIKEL